MKTTAKNRHPTRHHATQDLWAITFDFCRIEFNVINYGSDKSGYLWRVSIIETDDSNKMIHMNRHYHYFVSGIE